MIVRHGRQILPLLYQLPQLRAKQILSVHAVGQLGTNLTTRASMATSSAISKDAPTASSGPSTAVARFSTFDVTSQVFVERNHTFGIVNLKPIVPLHLLVITRKPYARLRQVPPEELRELFATVQEASNVAQDLTGSPSCTISIQDGKEAGQSVPHLHVHILPRKAGDFVPKDAIYAHLEAFGLGLHRSLTQAQASISAGESENIHETREGGQAVKDPTGGNEAGDQDAWPRRALAPDAEEDRPSRTVEEMAQEAAWLRSYF